MSTFEKFGHPEYGVEAIDGRPIHYKYDDPEVLQKRIKYNEAIELFTEAYQKFRRWELSKNISDNHDLQFSLYHINNRGRAGLFNDWITKPGDQRALTNYRTYWVAPTALPRKSTMAGLRRALRRLSGMYYDY
jgi:hypothetical protein